MKRNRVVVLLGIPAMMLTACASQSHFYYADTSIDPMRYPIDCEGEFDAAPKLLSGKVPVYPVSMLNPDVIEDRKIRHLPMAWPVVSTFTVASDGTTSDIESTTTQPASFGRHMTIAVRTWRFEPAKVAAVAVPARCSAGFKFILG